MASVPRSSRRKAAGRLRKLRGAATKLNTAYREHLKRTLHAPAAVNARERQLVKAAFKAVSQAANVVSIPGIKRAELVGAEVLQAAIERNVGLIVKIADESRAELASMLKAGTSPEAIAAAFNVNLSRAEFWARDQTLKTNSDLTRIRAQRAGFPAYRWITARDEFVRDEHAALEGDVIRWDDPPEPGHPGEDFNCRCIAEPLAEDELET